MRIADGEPTCAYFKDPVTKVVHEVAWCTDNFHTAIRCTVVAVTNTSARKPRGIMCLHCISIRERTK